MVDFRVTWNRVNYKKSICVSVCKESVIEGHTE